MAKVPAKPKAPAKPKGVSKPKGLSMPKSLSKWVAVLRRSPVGALACVLVLAFVALAVVAPFVFGHGANNINVATGLQGPSSRHLLGTDSLGRDLLDRVLVASRLSLTMAAIATAIAMVGGLILGSLPAVVGRRLGGLIGAFINLTIAFPGLLVAIFLAMIFGLGVRGAVLAIGVAGIPTVARLTQTLTASVSSADYVTAARMLGVRRGRIIGRHVLPNIAGPIVISISLSLGGALLAFAGLSFLGVGVQQPSYDWGALVNQGLTQISTDPAASLGPAVAVILAGASFNLLGDAIARVLGVTSLLARRRVKPPAVRKSVAGARVQGPVLDIEGLQVAFPGAAGWVTPVTDVSFAVAPGEVLGIVGESGSGKSLTAMGASRLVDATGAVSAVAHYFDGTDISSGNIGAFRALLGTSLSMVFQDPLAALNPAIKVGPQLAEVSRVHLGARRSAALTRAVDRLGAVRLPNPRRVAHQYPHELSGGMRQRAVIGMGLMGSPKLVIVDEPTTALDVTVQSQILQLLHSVRDEQGAAILLISHDIAVVGRYCDRVLVMYGGRIVEDLPATRLRDAAHPYTRALIATVPDMTTDRDQPLATIPGRPPDPANLPSGCAFSPRCAFATDRCRQMRPPLADLGGGRRLACWHPQDAESVQASDGDAVRA